VSHLETGCATHGIPAPTEGACGMHTFFPANKAFLDIFISSKNMLFLTSTLCLVWQVSSGMKPSSLFVVNFVSCGELGVECVFSLIAGRKETRVHLPLNWLGRML